MPMIVTKFDHKKPCEICSTSKTHVKHIHISSRYHQLTTNKIPKTQTIKRLNLIMGDSLTNNMENYKFRSEIMLESFGGADYERTYATVQKLYEKYTTPLNVLIMLGVNFVKKEIKDLQPLEILEKIDIIKKKALKQLGNLTELFRSLNTDNKIYIARIPAVPELYYLEHQRKIAESQEKSNKHVKLLIQQINLAIDYINKPTGFKGELNVDQIAIKEGPEGKTYDLLAFRERDMLKKCHYSKKYEEKIYQQVDEFFLLQNEKKKPIPNMQNCAKGNINFPPTTIQKYRNDPNNLTC